MNFLSLVFIAALPVIMLLYRFLGRRMRPWLLLVSSWAFYLYGNIDSFWILLSVTVISYICGNLLSNARVRGNTLAKRAVLITGSLSVLSFLIFYKYIKASTFLPVGISFYTFQTFAYIIDVYKGLYPGERNFFSYSLFVSFFPQLVAGPIERPKSLLPQLKEAATPSKTDYSEGIALLITGYFKKIVVADYIAPLSDRVFSLGENTKGLVILLGAFLFALQIYADFSGYSDIARGCGRLLGINLSTNFRHPYLSANIRDFWRNWHITLTSWFTDYIYIPLGGNRKGKFRTCINTLIVFGLSGIWHGAGIKFFVWGISHSLLILLEDIPLLQGLRKKLPRLVNIFINFVLISLLWIFFRAQSLSIALSLFENMLLGIADFNALLIFDIKEYALMAICAVLVYLVPKYTESKKPKSFAIMYILVLVIIGSKINQIRSGLNNSFIYFSF